MRRMWMMAGCALLTVFAAFVPFAKVFYKLQISYNEGWNVYAASQVAAHHLLYPARFAWTTINYPPLSFWLIAELHKVTGDYLFTARVVCLLSALACSALVGGIARRLGTVGWMAVLAGMFCLGTFCAVAPYYVGADDPQMLALVFFLAGLWVYVGGRSERLRLIAVALLFVVGAFVKQNPIDFPLAVLIDLWLLSRARAVWLAGWMAAFAGVATAVTIHVGGPYFLAELLAPRGYTASHVWGRLQDVFGQMLVPTMLAMWACWRLRRDEQRRVVPLLLVCSLMIGGYFSGGDGVSVNALFSALLAVLIALPFAWEMAAAVRWRGVAWDIAVPTACFAWLLIPMTLSGAIDPGRQLQEAAAEQVRFRQDVDFLVQQPGPALCESLLRCYFAQKLYVYDPFNATRFVLLGKLDPAPMLAQLQARQFGAIQLDEPVEIELQRGSDLQRFPPSMLRAIAEDYRPALRDGESVMYVPKDSK